MLTGDMQKAAGNISHSCDHFLSSTNLEFATQRKSEEGAKKISSEVLEK